MGLKIFCDVSSEKQSIAAEQESEFNIQNSTNKKLSVCITHCFQKPCLQTTPQNFFRSDACVCTAPRILQSNVLQFQVNLTEF